MAAALEPATQTNKTPAKKTLKRNYPATRRSDHVDVYHGVKVGDPYRWLEDPDSKETSDWVAAENKLTFAHLDNLPLQDAFRKRITKLWNYERFGQPRKRPARYFYEYNNGLQNQSVLYVEDGPGAKPRVLIDPNTLSDDGAVALSSWRASDDGKLLAYGISTAGSDWKEWRIRDVATGKDLPDRLEWVKFSGVSWLPDGSGLYYSRYDAPKEGEEFTGANYHQKLFLHTLGQPQSADALIYQRKDEKEWGFDGEVSEDGRYLIISVWRGTERKNQVFYQDLHAPRSAVVELLSGFEAEYQVLGNVGPIFWLLTDDHAPRKRVIAIDTRQPARDQWREIIAQQDEVLTSVSMIGGRLCATSLHDAHSVVNIYDLQGQRVREVELPAFGSVSGFGGRNDDSETFFSFTNFTTPATIYRYDVASGKTTVFRQPLVDFQPSDYETRQVFVNSPDGARIPMYITGKKGYRLDGANPTILYGYGGFNISLTPGFSVTNLVWMEQGGLYAVPNLRGGGEYGRLWHEAGMKNNKQNVFDDFIAAAEWLIANKYTNSERLAIRGGSNGGLLVGAAMTQRPELFAAANPAVGVLDMLRYHEFTIGWAWVSEYGSSADADEFRTLLAYSPLHNLQKGRSYPATLVTTGDHDDRVVPAHSFKFAATLQAAQGGAAPVLIRIETRAGHGAGKPTSKRIAEAADVLAFIADALGMQPQKK